MGAIATQPLDVLKTRLQSSAVASAYAQAQGTFFTKTFSSLRNMFVNEGMRGAFSGLVPNLIGVIPSRYATTIIHVTICAYTTRWNPFYVYCRALYFGSYSSTKQVLQNLNFEPNSVSTHFVSAAVAHTAVVCTMNPIFLVKTRIQLESIAKNNQRQQFLYANST